jgi:hypothetical protein
MGPSHLSCNICGRLALEGTLLANQGMCMACVRSERDKSLSQLDDALRQQLGILYVSNPLMLPRNKNTAYREIVLTFSLGVAQAFDEMQLTNISLVERYEVNPEHFYMAAPDLTETGELFARQVFDKWRTKTSRWKPESRSIDRLKQSLSMEFKTFQGLRNT